MSVSEGSPTEGIGARLKRLRSERGFSQRDLSSPGVSYAYISRIEAGARTPSVKALRKLAQKLGVSVEYLETGRDIREVDDRELRLADAELELRLAESTVEAEQKLRAVLAEAAAAGDVTSALRARIALGLAAAQRGSHLAAVEQLEESIRDENVPPPHLRPDLYVTLGQSYAALGAPDRSVLLFERCLKSIEADVPDDVAAFIRYATFLSYALTDAGDYERAGEIVRDALRRAGDQEDPYTRVRLYWSMARLSGMAGRAAEALEYIRSAIALLKATDDGIALARAYLLAAGIEIRRGDPTEARRHLELAEKLLGAVPERADLGILRIGESRVATLEGDAGRAVEKARDALALLGDFHGGEQGAAVHALASGLALQGDNKGAEDAYRRSVDLLTVHGRRSDAGDAALEWAEFLKEQGRAEEAEPILRRAYDLGVDAETATHTR
ncbi:MAG TPA: helix-turn-helix domain-containing protein [Gaiellaceae bacterium]|nr:helix-turn-helix domain-containing protein [Gaiellaceae bacterium]